MPHQLDTSSKANSISDNCFVEGESFNYFISSRPTQPCLHNYNDHGKMSFNKVQYCFPKLGLQGTSTVPNQYIHDWIRICSKVKLSTSILLSTPSSIPSSLEIELPSAWLSPSFLGFFDENGYSHLQLYELEKLHSMEIAHHHVFHEPVLKNLPHYDYWMGPLIPHTPSYHREKFIGPMS